MHKYIAIFSSFFFVNHAYAQFGVMPEPLQCPNIIPHINIIIQETPIQYFNNLSSSQLMRMSNSESGGINKGKFTGDLTFSLQSQLSALKQNNGSICAKPTVINLVIGFRPVIYLSSTLNAFPCVYNTTYQHEMRHYSIHKNALNNLQAQLPQYLKNQYNKYFNAYTMSEINSQVDSLNANINKVIQDNFKANTDPYHKNMDTPANYQNEANLCSEQENRTFVNYALQGR